MSVMTRHLVKILQCDKRYFSLTENKVDQLEEVVMNTVDVEKSYDEMTEKTVYILHTDNGNMQFESKHRADALCKLILWTPCLYEPVRNRYNQMVSDRYKAPRDRREERKEARYQRRLELIKKLNSI